ncbi:hypothetical protein [Bifidobacterium pongonis]|nr:hypothetical protein [Bifidobacterium pongonis]
MPDFMGIFISPITEAIKLTIGNYRNENDSNKPPKSHAAQRI